MIVCGAIPVVIILFLFFSELGSISIFNSGFKSGFRIGGHFRNSVRPDLRVSLIALFVGKMAFRSLVRARPWVVGYLTRASCTSPLRPLCVLAQYPRFGRLALASAFFSPLFVVCAKSKPRRRVSRMLAVAAPRSPSWFCGQIPRVILPT